MKASSQLPIHPFYWFRASRSVFLFCLALIMIIAVIFLVTGVAYAQDTDPNVPTDDEVNAIAKEMYCPVCENVPLDVCGTQACAQWRALIREKLGEGWTEEQIKQYFVDQYGARVLSEPPAEGLNWLVYVVPPIAFLAGAFILYRGIQSWRQIEPEGGFDPRMAEENEEPIDEIDEYMARLEEELRRSER
jgi:cytochrome c-type biogenesis protein CcmH